MLTVEERKEKFQKLINNVAEIQAIMKEFNEQSYLLNNCERILSVSVSFDIDNRIHIVGVGDEEIVEVVKLDKAEDLDDTYKRFYTIINGIKVFQLKEYEE